MPDGPPELFPVPPIAWHPDHDRYGVDFFGRPVSRVAAGRPPRVLRTDRGNRGRRVVVHLGGEVLRIPLDTFAAECRGEAKP